MASTLPKSVQAQMASRESDSFSHERSQAVKKFIEKYRNLPEDFLRLEQHPYDDLREYVAQNIPAGPDVYRENPSPFIDMMEVSVVEAQLVKNYGLLRMDLYCKIRVGHLVCETQTCPNGGKNPKWVGFYQFNLKPGIDSFHLEIYDERQFQNDEKIAWLSEPIPAEIFQGVTIERWYPLSGKLGNNKEGSILLVLSHKRVPNQSHSLNRPLQLYLPTPNQPQIIGGRAVVPIDPPLPTYISSMPPPQPSSTPTNQEFVQPPNPTPTIPPPVTPEDVNQLNEMFPSIDRSVIKSILENHNNDKQAAISYLLSLS